MGFGLKNFTIEKFNSDVNNSGNLADKYDQWGVYRTQINKFMAKSIEDSNKFKNIIVLGAGECNDVDLHYLTEMFDEVMLTDVDVLSIDDGIRRQKITQEQIKKIRKIQVDYTGLGAISFFETLSDMVRAKKSHAEISDYINGSISALKTGDVLSEHHNDYDFVLVCPTYTQLVYTQMEVLLKILYQYGIYGIDELNNLITTMHSLMPTIIENYNKLLLSLVNKGGLIFMLTDIAEISTDSDELKDVKQLLSNNDILSLEDYLSDNALEFGEFGCSDLKKNINTIDEFWSIWPFDGHKQYLVYGVIGSNPSL